MTVALYDWAYQPQGQVASYESCTVDWMHLDAGTGTLVITEESRFVPLLLRADVDPVLVRVTVNGVPWSGRVVTVDLERKGKRGSGMVTASLVSDWIWLRYMLASQNGPDPSLSGMPEYDVQTGPAATVAAYFINAAAVRLNLPVVAIAPDDDTSGVVTVRGRFPVTLAELLTDTLSAEGVVVDVDAIADPVPLITFTLRAAAGNPPVRWNSETQLASLHLQVNGATGYTANVGLGGDGVAATYTTVTDDPEGGLGGPYALPEVGVDASGAASATEGQARGLEELRNHRGNLNASFEVQDGRPWKFGTDYRAGDSAAVTVLGEVFLDRITKVSAADTAREGLTIVPALGDLAIDESVGAMMVRALANVQAQVRMLRAGR